MYMTASRRKIDGRPMLKLNIHDFEEEDISFLDSIGIDQVEEGDENVRFTFIYSQEDFLNTRSTILQRYDAEEKGPRVYLTLKTT